MKPLLPVLLTVGMLLTATSFGGPPTWYVQLSPNMAGPWTNAASGTSSQMFARLMLSNALASTISLGGVVTVANTTGFLSNGVGYATIVLSTNDWNAMTSNSGIHSNLWEVMITHQ